MRALRAESSARSGSDGGCSPGERPQDLQQGMSTAIEHLKQSVQHAQEESA